MKKILLSSILLMAATVSQVQSQSNLQITFNSGLTALAGADTVYMYGGIGISSPSDHWQYGTGELVQPGSGIGRMTNIGTNLWGICLEPVAYFSQGPAGPVPGGATIYNIDVLFHNPNFTAYVDTNDNGATLYFDMFAGTPPPQGNWPGHLSASFQNCTLGINDLQISHGVLTNFPNPIIEKTRFIYTLKSSGNVLLKIYNAIGQEVRTVVNEFQNPGTYGYNWKGDNDSGRILYDGVYFYTLSMDGKTIQTNKLIISR